MSKKFLMKCGHVSNAVDDSYNSLCLLCKCYEKAKEQPNLLNREARCKICGNICASDLDLPLSEYKPTEEYDSYYCGCGGWD